ncbi:hypothetical protein D5086_010872 [Populus alba]|uniref:Uncharacterized protein n=2 Tax=Populus TaxID=3689 RepID=A0ACC4CAQ9_POPAL|nr:hypothetical protein POTOM_019460 [Populus tomentosa]
MDDKKSLASAEELAKVNGKASLLAAVDYFVSLQSDVFISASPGNMHNALKSRQGPDQVEKEAEVAIPDCTSVITGMDFVELMMKESIRSSYCKRNGWWFQFSQPICCSMQFQSINMKSQSGNSANYDP